MLNWLYAHIGFWTTTILLSCIATISVYLITDASLISIKPTKAKVIFTTLFALLFAYMIFIGWYYG